MATLLATLRGAGIHGDQDDATFTFDQTPTLATPPTPVSYDTLPLNTVSVDGSADLGAITHLIFYVRVRAQNPLAGVDIAAITSQLIKWQSPGGTPASSVPDLPGFPNNVWASVRTPNIATRPLGGGWTWADVNNLALVGVSATFFLDVEPVAFYVGELDLADVWVEVWGDAPPPPPPPPPPDTKHRVGQYVVDELLSRTGVDLEGRP
jgi:hypothetical protein